MAKILPVQTTLSDGDYSLCALDPVTETSKITVGNLRKTILPDQTGNSGKFLTTNGTTPSWADAILLQAMTPGGRLTYSSSDPLAYGSSNSSIYYLPYTSNVVAVYDGSKWVLRTFSSLNITGFISGKVSDVWVYDNAGTLAGELTDWANTTTRATALAYQDGVLVKSGTPTRRFVGTLWADYLGVGPGSMGIWNLYNQVDITLEVFDSNSHTYNTSTVREWNNNTGSRIRFVMGLANLGILGFTAPSVTNSINSTGSVGCGINTTTSFGNTNNGFAGVLSANFVPHTNAAAMGVAGLNYATALEWGSAGGANAPTFVSVATRVKVRG